MFSTLVSRCALGALVAVGALGPALADGPLSVYAGPQFITQGAARDIAGTTQFDLGANYDFGPKTIVPIRAALQLDDAFGSSNSGRIGTFGFGASARLTTPLYAGIGASIYNTSVRANYAGGSLNTSATGVGTNIFVGNTFLGLPGIGLSIEGSYKQIPTANGINPSAYGVGVRASF